MTKTKYYIAKTLDTLNMLLRGVVIVLLIAAVAPLLLVSISLMMVLLFLEHINSEARAWFALPDEDEVDKNKKE